MEKSKELADLVENIYDAYRNKDNSSYRNHLKKIALGAALNECKDTDLVEFRDRTADWFRRKLGMKNYGPPCNSPYMFLVEAQH